MSTGLKEKGNEYFVKGDYEKAVGCYSEALTLKPEDHLILSNRSGAYSKLRLYQKAYDDAVQCVSLAPEFARGYLRKASALFGLEKYKQAMAASERGYCLRGSDRICKDCVSQWITAATSMLEKDVANLKEVIPGVLPLTEGLLKILCDLEEQNDSGGISVQLLKGHMFKIADELGHVLKLFGHSLSPCLKQWTTSVMQSLQTDPRTHYAPAPAIELLAKKSKELVAWLDSEVDHLLYPILQPVFGLLTLCMITCAYSLSHMVSSRSFIQTLTKASLCFYRESILANDDYLRLHIHALQCLLNSFCMEIGHNKTRGREEALEIKSLTTELQSVFSRYDSSSRDYAEVQRSIKLVIENVSVIISPADPDQEQQSFKRITKEDAEMLKSQVTMEIERLIGIGDLHLRDMDVLVLATGGLLHIGEKEFARMALKKSESFYLSVISKLLESKLLALNNAAECLFHPQAMMLCNAFFFAGIDNHLVANVFITWKCLATELYALLARAGISASLLNVFNKIESFKLSDTETKKDDNALVGIADHYKQEVTDVVQKWGKKALNILLDQSWNKIQDKLGPDQLLLQYCMSPKYDTNCHPVPIPPKVLSCTGVVIAILKEGPPIVKSLDFGKIQKLAVESHQKSMKVVATKPTGKPWHDLQVEADKAGSELLQALLPDDLQAIISGPSIARLYFCPDQVLAKFPIGILPFRDGKRLGDVVALTYLSSARELLRESAVSLLYSDSVTEENNPGTSKKCIIFANPNFDMERSDHQKSNHWGFLGSLLEPFFSTPTKGVAMVHSLPGSESEGHDIEYLLSSCQVGGDVCQVEVAMGDDATLHSTLQVDSPLVLHFATHGFSSPDFHYQYHNFWTDSKSGLLLAGANTYRLQKYSAISKEAGTGELSAMAACGMKLLNTRLVYLSSCRSSYGFIGRGETLSSLAQSFRIAGSKTVIATLWPVSDEVGRKMAVQFYFFIKQGMCPSLALQAAQKKLCEEDSYEHWYNWAGFLCIGLDLPIFV